MKIIWFKLVIFVFALAPYLAKAGGDEVIVIYNMRLPESKEVAEYYAQRRHVPTNQVFGFDLPTGADISRTEYHDALEKPLAKRLEARDLWKIRSQTVPETSGVPMHIVWKVTQSKIRYAVLCYGVPYRIPEDPQLKEEQLKKCARNCGAMGRRWIVNSPVCRLLRRIICVPGRCRIRFMAPPMKTGLLRPTTS